MHYLNQVRMVQVHRTRVMRRAPRSELFTQYSQPTLHACPCVLWKNVSIYLCMTKENCNTPFSNPHGAPPRRKLAVSSLGLIPLSSFISGLLFNGNPLRYWQAVPIPPFPHVQRPTRTIHVPMPRCDPQHGDYRVLGTATVIIVIHLDVLYMRIGKLPFCSPVRH